MGLKVVALLAGLTGMAGALGELPVHMPSLYHNESASAVLAGTVLLIVGSMLKRHDLTR